MCVCVCVFVCVCVSDECNLPDLWMIKGMDEVCFCVCVYSYVHMIHDPVMHLLYLNQRRVG